MSPRHRAPGTASGTRPRFGSHGHVRVITAIRTLAIVGLAALSSCVPATRPAVPPAEPIALHAAVAYLTPNRCADVAERPCRTDDDCPAGPCVSVLPTTARAYGRDGGHTVRLGDRVLWQFGDSFTDAGILSSTAGWSDIRDPHTMRDCTDASGLPAQFLPFTAAERHFNETHAEPPACCRAWRECPANAPTCRCPEKTDCTVRLALWPGDGAESAPGVATVFYDRQRVGVAPYDFHPAGVGAATVRLGAAHAERVLRPDGEAALVFSPDEPSFYRGFRGAGADAANFYVHAAVHRRGCTVDVLLGRVPIARMAERDAFEFLSGVGWSTDLGSAIPVAAEIVGGLGSIAWNDHLRAYLSVWNDICTGGHQLLLRVAPTPQGPWSDPTVVDLAPFAARADAYYGTLHPAFSRGSKLLLSYFQPLDDVYGQLRLLQLRLR